eukprot:CAMPEP_0201567334 /NCGR_PEP_ID=MMETSP0190_2-20130828/7802_1 /ASSEMBLY_ACC=CAM_ASM_000263 /TAXON_ID=37353 /ORGANISM="Rosalina sp." /LENGTH=59 /DNA_ID=CAMNT_0047987201 /DNA_START=93 /DNA_END=269 /DNA_ORIENTATION=+
MTNIPHDVPSDILGLMVEYYPNAVICGRNMEIDDIRCGNRLLGAGSGLVVSDEELNKYR